jgi:PKD repeat protein
LKINLIIACIALLVAEFAIAADPFTIKLNNHSPVQYCSDPVPIVVAQNLTISATITISGMKVSITNGFISGEDELVYSGAVGTISGTWNAAQGTMLLQPVGTANPSADDYVKAIESIGYKNNQPNPVKGPTIGQRAITISLIDADYLPATGHFYRFVEKTGIRWTTAKAEAESNAMMYFGLRGYLATVTSQVENDFIRLKTKGVGWIGASDAVVEGQWRWVTGPEGLEDSGKGRLFWNNGPIAGQYTNWNVGEPNDCCTNTPSEENYAHITYFPNDPASSYKWNDLPNYSIAQNYVPAGYLIEFGGFPDDPVVELSATLELQVNTITFSADEIPAICEGESVTLNQPDNNAIPATYQWSPTTGLSNPSVANPVASPLTTTTYSLTATRGTCSVPRDFTVTVIPKPKVDFSVDPTTCYGYSIDVAYTGDADPSVSNFCWIFDNDTVANGTGASFAQVNIPLGVVQSNREITLAVTQNGCTNSHTVSNILVKPELSLPEVNAAIRCQNEPFDFSVVNPNPQVKYDWNFGDGTIASGINPEHQYLQPGNYTVQLTATNSDNCTNTVSVKDMVFAAPLPIPSFGMDHSTVNNNNPTVNFANTSTGAVSYLWDFGDGTTSAGENPTHHYTAIGRYRVWLKAVSEQNCEDTISHPVRVAFDRIFPPNAFSPNAPDPQDRIFLLNATGIISQGYHFMVLSRWDDVVFEVKDEIKGWDGRMKNGSPAPAGSYLWVLDYADSLGFKHQQKGTLTLVY